MSDYDAIVVGGGHNGLVASFYLARAGLDVAVLERRAFVGGACATEELFDGYRVSSCAYIAWNLQEKVVRDMRLEDHGLDRTPIDPVPTLLFEDRKLLAVWADTERTKQEVARICPADAERLEEWLELWERAAGIVHPFFLRRPPSMHEIREHARSIGEEPLLDRLLSASIAELAGEYFTDQRIGAAMMLICDVGDPYTPGSAWAEAWWHTNVPNGSVPSVVRGGMGGVTQAMATAAREVGAEIRTDAEVEQILVQNGAACGVRLAGGEELTAPVVLSNADPKRTYLRLLAPDDLPDGFRSRVKRISTQASYLKFHAVLDRPLDLSPYLGDTFDPRYSTYVTLAPHGFDSYRTAWEDARRGEPAREPVCHLQVPTAYDDTLTDGDGEVVSIWALYAPPHLSDGTWDERRERVGEALIDHVTRFLPSFRRDLREWRLYTPADIERRTAITDGCIRHVDMISSQLYDQRPLPDAGYASPVPGLWLCGTGTHPGGEVTGAPGHNAAHAVLEAIGRPTIAGQAVA
ncbi:MAG TPA: NAD(P)/FAD-dependent oxidoreductase [Solirubrobacteraceae bacterium]|nr:NAD(P)/FAD-dependent oxidoreductase [Solirubrobacteraceae bacterium]